MRAPDFWFRPKPSLRAYLLRPLGWVYGEITTRRMAKPGWRSPLPVFCIGNFVAGGAGKTPTAIAIARRLQARGENPAFLSRGYGGSAPGPLQVDPLRQTAKEVGDEALLLARIAPTFVGSDRVASARRAQEAGASLLLLDDGLQNPALVHDLRLAVVDGEALIGNGLCLPAGPLRAPLARQLESITAVLLIERPPVANNFSELIRRNDKPVFTASFDVPEETARQLSGRKVVAFAGIGLPRKFRRTLEEIDARIVGWHGFADHHIYSAKELAHLQRQAAESEALLVTTEKDLVRIGPQLAELDQDLPLPAALPVEIAFDDETALDALLNEALRRARGT